MERLSGRSGEEMVRSVQKTPPLGAPIPKGPDTLSLFIIYIYIFSIFLFFIFLWVGNLGVIFNSFIYIYIYFISFSGKMKRHRFDGGHLRIQSTLPPWGCYGHQLELGENGWLVS